MHLSWTRDLAALLYSACSYGSCMVTLGKAHPLDDCPQRSERGCITYREMRLLGHTSGTRSYALTVIEEHELLGLAGP